MRATIVKVTLALVLVHAGPSSAADDSYDVSKTDASATVGGKAKASVTIKAKNGWHLNQEAPLTLKLTPEPGVVVDKPKLGRADLALSNETEARFDVGMTLSEMGKKIIEVEAVFVLCQQESCRPIREKIKVSAEATAAPATPAPKLGTKKVKRT